jgi:acyl-CoA reductase-like NAD-dependent aldehyde dehydrogenase
MATARKPKSSPPAKKSARGAASAPAEGKKTEWPALAPTGVDGVFRNGAGCLVNKDGILLSLLDSRKAEAQDFGEAVDSPAKFLKAVALDPRAPLATRLEAAKAAAPYTDRKQPTGVDGGVGPDGQPLPIAIEITLPAAVMAKLSDTELQVFDKVLGLLKEHGLVPKETQ